MLIDGSGPADRRWAQDGQVKVKLSVKVNDDGL